MIKDKSLVGNNVSRHEAYALTGLRVIEGYNTYTRMVQSMLHKRKGSITLLFFIANKMHNASSLSIISGLELTSLQHDTRARLDCFSRWNECGQDAHFKTSIQRRGT